MAVETAMISSCLVNTCYIAFSIICTGLTVRVVGEREDWDDTLVKDWKDFFDQLSKQAHTNLNRKVTCSLVRIYIQTLPTQITGGRHIKHKWPLSY